MNASVAGLDREVEVQSKIRKVSTFSRYARVLCSALFAFGLVGSVVVLLIGTLGLFMSAPENGAVEGFTTRQKVWGLPMAALVIGVWLGAVYQLYRLFGNLAKGSIYTAENVRRVRNVGLLWMLSAVLSIAIPYAWAALVEMGLLEQSEPSKLEAWLSWSKSLYGLASGGLVLLISWVMDVGLYEKDHAEALRRDADLVI